MINAEERWRQDLACLLAEHHQEENRVFWLEHWQGLLFLIVFFAVLIYWRHGH